MDKCYLFYTIFEIMATLPYANCIIAMNSWNMCCFVGFYSNKVLCWKLYNLHSGFWVKMISHNFCFSDEIRKWKKYSRPKLEEEEDKKTNIATDSPFSQDVLYPHLLLRSEIFLFQIEN